MTPDAFRLLVVALPGAREHMNLGVQEFRIKDRTFATLGSPDAGWAMVKLAAADQTRFMARSTALSPEPGGRGARGATRLKLSGLTADFVANVVTAACRRASRP